MDTDSAPAVEYDALLPPLRWPRKVICAGVNYRRHMKEMGGEIPAEGWRPFFFLKAPTTSIVGPHDPIVVRSPDEARYDWEAELAAVIGIGGRDIPAAGALAHVAGYCVANDVTARGRHRRQAVPPTRSSTTGSRPSPWTARCRWGRASRPRSRCPIRRICGCGCG